MKNRILFCLLIMILITTSSCGALKLQPLQTRDLGLSRTFEKNYVINSENSAYVGEEIVKLKDYYVHKKQTNKVKASNDFTFASGAYGGSKDDEFNVVGTTGISGVPHYVIVFPQYPEHGVVIDRYGTVTGDLVRVSGRDTVYLYKFSVIPPNTKFTIVIKEEIDASKGGFVNFDIVYTGRDKDSIKFIYREYSPNDIAKPAFYQSLTYDIRSKFIRFRNLRIEVLDANDEKITYKVLEDGLKQ